MRTFIAAYVVPFACGCAYALILGYTLRFALQLIHAAQHCP